MFRTHNRRAVAATRREHRWPRIRQYLFCALLLPMASALAHVNDRGMDYSQFTDWAGVPCCSKDDCQAAEQFIELKENGREVVRLLIDGVWITVSRSFLAPRQATDGRAHWCGIKLRVGNLSGWTPGTRCIILPPRML
jgi:hypothetical protein